MPEARKTRKSGAQLRPDDGRLKANRIAYLRSDRRFKRFIDRVLAPGVLFPRAPEPIDVRNLGWLPPGGLFMLDEIENFGLRYLEAAPRQAERPGR